MRLLSFARKHWMLLAGSALTISGPLLSVFCGDVGMCLGVQVGLIGGLFIGTYLQDKE